MREGETKKKERIGEEEKKEEDYVVVKEEASEQEQTMDIWKFIEEENCEVKLKKVLVHCYLLCLETLV